MSRSWPCEDGWEEWSRQREQRMQRAPNRRGCRGLKNLSRPWRQEGGRGKNWGTQKPHRFSGDGAGRTLRAAPGQRARRGEDGGREVREEAPAGVLVPGRLRDATIVMVTWGQAQGMTEDVNYEPQTVLLMPPRDDDQTSGASLQVGACFRKEAHPAQPPPSPVPSNDRPALLPNLSSRPPFPESK